MSDFSMWLEEGYKHIVTPDAADHFLYCFALCLSYQLSDWRKILLLITAFTIGHSITLVAVSMNYLSINVKWVEFAIPLTIAATCIYNLVKGKGHYSLMYLYFVAIVFGLIHGMAYGVNDMSQIEERKSKLIEMVLGFNLGVELGQLVAIAWFLAVSYVVIKLLKAPFRYWQVCLSSLILIYAIFLAIKNLP